MQTYIIIGIAAFVLISAFWICISVAIREAKARGASDVIAQSSEDARELQEEMADEVITPNTNEEVKEKLRKGKI